MALIKPLKEKLTQYIVENNLAILFESLKDLLIDDSEHRVVLILNESNYNKVKRKIAAKTISNSDSELSLNQINKALFETINDLKWEDFNFKELEPNLEKLRKLERIKKVVESKKPGESEKPEEKPKRGSIFHRIPNRMEVNKRTKCMVRIAFEEEDIFEHLTKEKGDVVLDRPIGDFMEVSIFEPDGNSNFIINHASGKEQYISPFGYSEWIIDVTPLQEGTFVLYLKIGIILEIDGKATRRDWVVDKEITISSEAAEEPESAKHPMELYKSNIHFYTVNDQSISWTSTQPTSPSPYYYKQNNWFIYGIALKKILMIVLGLGTIPLGYFTVKDYLNESDEYDKVINRLESCNPGKAIESLDVFIKKEGFWFAGAAKDLRVTYKTIAPWMNKEKNQACIILQQYLAECPNGEFAEQAQADEADVCNLIDLCASNQKTAPWLGQEKVEACKIIDRYLADCPNGKFTEQARVDKTELCGKIIPCAYDQKTAPWLGQEKTLVCEIIENYLAKCPDGKFAEEAKASKEKNCDNTYKSLDVIYGLVSEEDKLWIKIANGTPSYQFTIGWYGRTDKNRSFDTAGKYFIDLKPFKEKPGEYSFKIIDGRDDIFKSKILIPLDCDEKAVFNFNKECFDITKVRAEETIGLMLYFYQAPGVYDSEKMRCITFANPKVKETMSNFFKSGTSDISNLGNCSLPSEIKKRPCGCSTFY